MGHSAFVRRRRIRRADNAGRPNCLRKLAMVPEYTRSIVAVAQRPAYIIVH
jgi:hypothetical protein